MEVPGAREIPKQVVGPTTKLNSGRKMKIRFLALVGLAISFALPIFAQQTNAPDPQLHQQLVALFKKFDEVWNSNDHAAWGALFTDDAIEVTNTEPIVREPVNDSSADPIAFVLRLLRLVPRPAHRPCQGCQMLG
jgi:hypothetical protein